MFNNEPTCQGPMDAAAIIAIVAISLWLLSYNPIVEVFGAIFGRNGLPGIGGLAS